MSKIEKKWKSAVWQYLIDHDQITNSGEHYISFYIKDEAQFWKRVRAREKNYFSRNDEKKLQGESVNKLKEAEKYRRFYNESRRWDNHCKKFHQSKRPLDRIMSWIFRQCYEYRKKRLKEIRWNK